MASFPELAGQVVLVTGAASGIGAATAAAFLDQGSRVVSADLAFASVEPEPAGERLWRVRLDVTDEAAVASAVSAIAVAVGPVDAVVHAAGISTMDFAVEATYADWQKTIDVNATGSFLVARAVAQQLVETGRPGRIVLLASQAGKNGYRAMTSYVASKHAVMGLTKTMAVELAPQGVLVNAICPGIIETAMKHRERVEGAELRGLSAADIEAEDSSQVPLGRTGTAEDVAGVALFLASDLASYMTGQGINVTGGMTMH
ncbi:MULTISPECIES: SDR family NAD(P)-dependent oxidoreductase [unclassified Microbacterium]|uniref:SDR family NAD(P)-dependent oxidoreductase n=1 Tax=unclassified Microbacterium TaxID=2609290 RepID=UPI00097F53C5|nr:SDR family NAD(P)-dependent oxidoreductase [Microbacterium sp. JB110]RCS61868.1 SDR family NAD(P)-dependent oxidoreductase [Microbacterium sp. JB110]SJM66327.1 3-oxoacyl-[acyl-carrier protein] reductase [Frigoribacterium sp. JB110]